MHTPMNEVNYINSNLNISYICKINLEVDLNISPYKCQPSYVYDNMNSMNTSYGSPDIKRTSFVKDWLPFIWVAAEWWL